MAAGCIQRSSYTIEDEIVSGDKVVVRVISSGRHTGELIGFKPTGKTFEAQQIHIYRVADEKIIEHWSRRDDLSQDLGKKRKPLESRSRSACGHLRRLRRRARNRYSHKTW